MNPSRRVEPGSAVATLESPVGPLSLEACERGLTRVAFVRRGEEPLPDRDGSDAARRILIATGRQLAEYFARGRRAFDLPLAASGTTFQLATWDALRRIEYGTTISYAELARRIGRPSAVRAVGAANGANPIPIVVPCHRVIGADGSLTGFGGGLEVKRALLRLEGVAVGQERLPLSG